jgi:hypothetical protein
LVVVDNVGTIGVWETIKDAVLVVVVVVVAVVDDDDDDDDVLLVLVETFIAAKGASTLNVL